MLEVLGDEGSGEGPSFKKGLPLKMHFHENVYKREGHASRVGTLLAQYHGIL